MTILLIALQLFQCFHLLAFVIRVLCVEVCQSRSRRDSLSARDNTMN